MLGVVVRVGRCLAKLTRSGNQAVAIGTHVREEIIRIYITVVKANKDAIVSQGVRVLNLNSSEVPILKLTCSLLAGSRHCRE